MKLKVRVIAKRNTYGFGRDWTLSITKGKKHKNFWLGQGVKVCLRVLGCNMNELIQEAEKKFGTREFDNPDFNAWLGEQILSAMYDNAELKDIAKDVFNRQVWELSVE